ncbi:LysE family transporter [Serratia ficaria]|uniref:LysE family transporter n=2 Tax=Serratia TaxID=613 RepID=UPI002916DEC2|nr:LysE family transporter [Serratia ficaria]
MLYNDFLVTSLLIVMSPGTGAIITLSAGLRQGKRSAIIAAAGCTLGVLPHMLAAITGLAAFPPCQDSCRLELKNFRGPETTKMNTYSPERKAALIARMMPPHNQSVVQLARSEGIPANTLYAWRTQAGVGAAESLSPAEWSQDARFAVLVETAPLSAHAVAEYCRRKGLYPEQIQQWRDQFMQPGQREERALIKKQQKEIQQLNREIARKDKALAEAAALLILEKKLKAFFSEEREDE